MQALPRDTNPFALLLDPQAVLAQIEHSERLERLQRRVCRPLDKPLLGALAEDGDELTDTDTDSDGAARTADSRPEASNHELRAL